MTAWLQSYTQLQAGPEPHRGFKKQDCWRAKGNSPLSLLKFLYEWGPLFPISLQNKLTWSPDGCVSTSPRYAVMLYKPAASIQWGLSSNRKEDLSLNQKKTRGHWLIYDWLVEINYIISDSGKCCIRLHYKKKLKPQLITYKKATFLCSEGSTHTTLD